MDEDEALRKFKELEEDRATFEEDLDEFYRQEYPQEEDMVIRFTHSTETIG